jgi:hypothetical protein
MRSRRVAHDKQTGWAKDDELTLVGFTNVTAVPR